MNQFASTGAIKISTVICFTLVTLTDFLLPALGSDSASTEFKKAAECSKAQQYIMAVKHLNEAIKIEPSNVKYHYERGMAYLQLREKEEALPDFVYCRNTAPNFPIAAKDWAQAYRAAGHFDHAINQWNIAISLEPRAARLYYLRAQTFLERELFAKAIDDYTSAIKIQPSVDSYYNERAQCYMQLKHFDKAIADFNQTLRANPASNGVFLHRALCNFEMARYNEAIADYTKAISIKPKEPKAYAMRAKVYERMGLKDLADADRKKARDIGEDFSL